MTGEMIIRKQDSPFATLKKGSKAKQYIALHDHFLLLFSSSDVSASFLLILLLSLL